jgi:2-dehydro-3-deoxy-D-arabinonate dehydratase
VSRLAGLRLIRFAGRDGAEQIGVVDGASVSVLPGSDPVALLSGDGLPDPVGSLTALDPDTLDLPPPLRLLAPLDPPETWAAGVTYERSRDARVEESQAKDVYSLVYDAERPELFLKDAASRRTVGPRGTIAVRSDAAWTVPEPELGLVLGPGPEPLAVTIGNDVSSRDIEGANPLYLPQAKLYAGSCALGPALHVPEDWSEPFEIELRILDPDGSAVFEGRTSTARMRRSFAELIEFARRDNPLPAGTVLLTGTGLVPPDEVSLAPGQTVEIGIARVGRLVNRVGRAEDLL